MWFSERSWCERIEHTVKSIFRVYQFVFAQNVCDANRTYIIRKKGYIYESVRFLAEILKRTTWHTRTYFINEIDIFLFFMQNYLPFAFEYWIRRIIVKTIRVACTRHIYRRPNTRDITYCCANRSTFDKTGQIETCKLHALIESAVSKCLPGPYRQSYDHRRVIDTWYDAPWIADDQGQIKTVQ